MCVMPAQALEVDLSLFAYLCQKCSEYFICPAWKNEECEKKNKVAVCPHCKTNDIKALNTSLPLFCN